MILTFYPKAADGQPDKNKSKTIEMVFRFGAYDAYEFLWENARNWHEDGYEFVDLEALATLKPKKIKVTKRFQWNETEQGYRPITNNGSNGSIKL